MYMFVKPFQNGLQTQCIFHTFGKKADVVVKVNILLQL